ncbi:TonB-dependent receptor domain-containing protein [Sphingomonas psychrotolerans]|uniref:TonB-dependent receptor-like beta-barrel domain-containing protein n=1 Tax=Sphingomonas psychrotolerans TaxID=1327635 RepID=A0A2K8ME85_9SPHN|nr:TonB-dependent receptor [Sphingomonas psychrotolerans]ATY32208.1 hypothetical protein CVN68_09645 [Sphingomonas psychrotolerans]
MGRPPARIAVRFRVGTTTRSTNYDLSLEWYLSPVSYLSTGGFYKNLSDFLELQTLLVERFGRVFQDTRTRNGQTGYIRGIEAGGQYSLDFLGGFASIWWTDPCLQHAKHMRPFGRNGTHRRVDAWGRWLWRRVVDVLQAAMQ